MTFDDGMIGIYRVENTAAAGDMPKESLVLKDKYYFGYDTLGYNRYYTALQAHQQIEAVIRIPDWGDILPTDVCIMEDGKRYKIQMNQRMKDEDELKYTKLSLERLGEHG